MVTDRAKRCRAIYAAMLDNLPDSTKTDIFARGTFKVDADTNWYTEVSLARNHTTGRAAPSPSGRLGHEGAGRRQLPAHGDADRQPLLPAGAADPHGLHRGRLRLVRRPNGRKYTEVATRSLDRGNRVSDNTNEQYRAIVGGSTVMGAWDVDAAFTMAQSRGKLDYEGYLAQDPYLAALATGNVNPFGPNDAAGVALLDAAQLKGTVRKSKGTTMAFDAKASTELVQLGGGAMGLAIGADLRKEKATDRPTQGVYERGEHIGGEGSVPPTSASRNIYAVFSELAMPFSKEFELTAAARYDRYSDFGGTFNPMLRASATSP